MAQYIGILDGSGKTYGVRIPDLPGCYGGGATPEAAIADAMSAAREWVAQRETKGKAPTKARTMVQVLKAGEISSKRNEAAVIVPVVLDGLCYKLKNLSMVVPGLDPGINPTTQT